MGKLFHLFLCCLLASASALATESDPRREAESAAPAAQCFPASIDGLETAEFPADRIASLRTHRNTVHAGYNAPPFGLAITVYVYDRLPEGGEGQELADVTSATLTAHPGAEMVAKGQGNLPLSGKATAAIGGMFLWSEGTKDYGSLLWLVTGAHQHLKIRATYDRPLGKEAEAMQFATASIETVARSICVPG